MWAINRHNIATMESEATVQLCSANKLLLFHDDDAGTHLYGYIYGYIYSYSIYGYIYILDYKYPDTEYFDIYIDILLYIVQKTTIFRLSIQHKQAYIQAFPCSFHIYRYI